MAETEGKYTVERKRLQGKVVEGVLNATVISD